MSVVFTSTVKLHISAVYMGGVPVAVHDSSVPGSAHAAGGTLSLGGTNVISNSNWSEWSANQCIIG